MEKGAWGSPPKSKWTKELEDPLRQSKWRKELRIPLPRVNIERSLKKYLLPNSIAKR